MAILLDLRSGKFQQNLYTQTTKENIEKRWLDVYELKVKYWKINKIKNKRFQKTNIWLIYSLSAANAFLFIYLIFNVFIWIDLIYIVNNMQHVVKGFHPLERFYLANLQHFDSFAYKSLYKHKYIFIILQFTIKYFLNCNIKLDSINDCIYQT